MKYPSSGFKPLDGFLANSHTITGSDSMTKKMSFMEQIKEPVIIYYKLKERLSISIINILMLKIHY